MLKINLEFSFHSFQLFFVFKLYFSLSATLLVAVNEIKKSARQNGLSFYEYGQYNRNLLQLINENSYERFLPDSKMNRRI